MGAGLLFCGKAEAEAGTECEEGAGHLQGEGAGVLHPEGAVEAGVQL